MTRYIVRNVTIVRSYGFVGYLKRETENAGKINLLRKRL